jgi:hypothetical protein
MDLETLSADLDRPAAFRSWEKVYDKVRAGEMPPPRRKRPPQSETEAVLRALQAALTAADLRHKAGQGRAVFRRLNRSEYENTLRDLFELPLLNVRDLLPEDGRVEGYDKVGTALELSRVQLAKYLEAADRVLDQAIAPWLDRPEPLQLRLYPGEQNSFQEQCRSRKDRAGCTKASARPSADEPTTTGRTRRSACWKEVMVASRGGMVAASSPARIARAGVVGRQPYYRRSQPSGKPPAAAPRPRLEGEAVNPRAAGWGGPPGGRILPPWTTVRNRVTGVVPGSVNQSTATPAGDSLQKVNTLNQLYPRSQQDLYPQQTAAQQANTPLPSRTAAVDVPFVRAVAPHKVESAIREVTALLHARRGHPFRWVSRLEGLASGPHRRLSLRVRPRQEAGVRPSRSAPAWSCR